MEISKDNVFKTQYTSVFESGIRKKRTSRLKNFIKKYRLISLTIIAFIICLSFNCILIYNFMKILERNF